MKNYIPGRFYWFVFAILLFVFLWSLYRYKQTTTESFLESYNFSYTKNVIEKRNPQITLTASSTIDGQDSVVSSIQIQSKIIKIPNFNESIAYELYVPILWKYISEHPNQIANNSLILTSFRNRDTDVKSWFEKLEPSSGDYWAMVSQNTPNQRYYKIMQYPSTIIQQKQLDNNTEGPLQDTFTLSFTQDQRKVEIIPKNDTEYRDFRRNLTQVTKNMQFIQQNINQAFTIACPYMMYPGNHNISKNGFSIEGFQMVPPNQFIPVASKFKPENSPLNRIDISSNDFSLFEVPSDNYQISSTIGGFPMTTPYPVFLVGRTLLKITEPKTITGMSVNGRLLLRLFGTNELFIDTSNSKQITYTFQPGKYDLLFEWTESTIKSSGEKSGFQFQINSQPIPASMIIIPDIYYLSFSDTSLYLTKLDGITYSSPYESQPNIRFLPRIEWQVENLAAPIQPYSSVFGQKEMILASPVVRIRTKQKSSNDPIYYLNVNPKTKQVEASLDLQSGWIIESTNFGMTIKTIYQIEQPYLSYQSIQNKDGTFLVRTNVLMSSTPSIWEQIPTL